MPIEKIQGGAVITGKAVKAFRFMQLKGALKLESIGLKSRGGAIRPKLAAELGLKPRDSYEMFIAACDARIATIKAQESAEGAAP